MNFKSFLQEASTGSKVFVLSIMSEHPKTAEDMFSSVKLYGDVKKLIDNLLLETGLDDLSNEQKEKVRSSKTLKELGDNLDELFESEEGVPVNADDFWEFVYFDEVKVS